MSFLRPQFPERTHELQHVAEDGFAVELWATDNEDGFDAKLQTVVEALNICEQITVFENGNPRYVIELDFDGNEVISEIAS